LAATLDGKHLVYACSGKKRLIRASLRNGKVLWSCKLDNVSMDRLVLSDDGRFALSAGGRGKSPWGKEDLNLRLWDATKGKLLHILSGERE
jgi:hypothetical protein